MNESTDIEKKFYEYFKKTIECDDNCKGVDHVDHNDEKEINQLLIKLKIRGFSFSHCKKFKQRLHDEGFYSKDAIEEDIVDAEQSQIFDFFRDDLSDESLFDILTNVIFLDNNSVISFACVPIQRFESVHDDVC